MGIFQSKTSTKKRINGNTFLLIITVVLFVVMYGAGMIMFEDKGFAKPQMFLNLFVSKNDIFHALSATEHLFL